MIEDLEKEISSYMATTKALQFDFVRISHFPYDDAYYDKIDAKNADAASRLRKDSMASSDEESSIEEEAKERLLLSVFFTEDNVLRRLEYVISKDGKVLPYKFNERHVWDLMHIIETMSFKCFFGLDDAK